MDNIDLLVFASVIMLSGLYYIFEEKKKYRKKRKKKFNEDVEIGLNKLKNGCSKFECKLFNATE